jgi:hypothetical protein
MRASPTFQRALGDGVIDLPDAKNFSMAKMLPSTVKSR